MKIPNIHTETGARVKMAAQNLTCQSVPLNVNDLLIGKFGVYWVNRNVNMTENITFIFIKTPPV